jgi:hypothetical protein
MFILITCRSFFMLSLSVFTKLRLFLYPPVSRIILFLIGLVYIMNKLIQMISLIKEFMARFLC